jgi:hypothetical protein
MASQDVAAELRSMFQLEYDTLRAYEEAIQRLNNAGLALAFNAFAHHHARHIAQLAPLLQSLAIQPRARASKGSRAEARVIGASLMSYRAVLRAMKMNEDETNFSYARLASIPVLWAPVRAWARSSLEDEQNHRAWIDEAIRFMGGGMTPESLTSSRESAGQLSV